MLSLLTTLVLAASPAGDQASSPEPPTTVQLTVDVSGLLGPEPEYIAELTQAQVHDDGMDSLTREHHVTVVNDPTAPTISVALSWAKYDESGEAAHLVVISTQRPGQEPETVSSFECSQCTDTDVSAKVVAQLGTALDQLAPPPAQPQTPPESDSPPGEVANPGNGEDPGTEKPKARPIGPLGVVGIVATAGGVGIAAYGGSLLAKGVEVQGQGDEERNVERDHRVPGRAWLGAGVGLAAAGIAVIIVDVTVLRKKRQRRTALVPSVDGSTLGLLVTGRF